MAFSGFMGGMEDDPAWERRDFALLHDRSLAMNLQGQAAAFCPAMDLVALLSSDNTVTIVVSQPKSGIKQ